LFESELFLFVTRMYHLYLSPSIYYRTN